MPTARERLLAAGSLVGLRRSIEILRDQLVEELMHVITTAPIGDLVAGLERVIERPRPRRTTRALPARKAPLALPPPSVTITQDGEHHVATLPNGRTLRGKRRRDVARRVREQGYQLAA